MRAMLRLSLATSLCALLTACVVGPDYHPSIQAAPTSWTKAGGQTKAGQPELADWWKRFGDAKLDALVDRAVAGAPDVASAKARVRQARATVAQSYGALFPTIGASAGASRSQRAGASGGFSSAGSGAYLGASRINNAMNGGFNGSWDLDLFGANKRAVEAAEYGLDSSDEDLRNVLLTVIKDVTTHYIELRSAQARLALARSTARTQRDTEALTRAKLASGGASALDVARATGQTATTEAGIPTLEALVSTYINALTILCGDTPGELTASLSPSAPLPAPRNAVRIGVPADVLNNRPDIRKAEYEFARATAEVGKAEAARYPSVSLTGNIATNASKPGDLGKNSTISWSFGPTLSVPVFNAGKLQAAVEAAGAQRDAQFVALRKTVLTALKEVEDAIVNLNQETRRIARLTTAVRAYGEAARLSRDLYQAGSISFLDVLTAENALYSAQNSLVTSRASRARAWSDLNVALGGGWNGAIDASPKDIVDVNTGPHLAPALARALTAPAAAAAAP